MKGSFPGGEEGGGEGGRVHFPQENERRSSGEVGMSESEERRKDTLLQKNKIKLTFGNERRLSNIGLRVQSTRKYARDQPRISLSLVLFDSQSQLRNIGGV